MQAIQEIGEIGLTVHDGDLAGRYFVLKPSLINIMQIGTPEFIVETFAILNGSEIVKNYVDLPDFITCLPALAQEYSAAIDRIVLSRARKVVLSCCDDADFTDLCIGDHRLIDDVAMVTLAKHLLNHGVIGQCEIEIPQSMEKQEYKTEFSAYTFVEVGMLALELSKDDAMNLTLTELQRMITKKYPRNQKDGLTRKEYDQVADDFEIMKSMKRVKQGLNNG